MRCGPTVEAVAQTVMAVGEISDAEVTQRLREVFDKPYPVFPIPGHPAMRPELGFVRFVSALPLGLPFFLFCSSNLLAVGLPPDARRTDTASASPVPLRLGMRPGGR